ncbi:phage tail assembly protein [Leucothrix sargassi]|nr:phage tail assembly protein [Leucothrix sargassi]
MTANTETKKSDVVNLDDVKAAALLVHYDLEYPIEARNHDGELVTFKKLSMRRPTLLDKIVAEKQVKDAQSYEATAVMLGNICNVPTDAIWEMDEEFDLLNLVKKFNEMGEEPEIESHNTLVLKHPFDIDGKLITKITMRRPKARDTLEFADEALGEKIARLCGYEKSQLHAMDLKSDWLGLESVYNSFRKRKPKR